MNLKNLFRKEAILNKEAIMEELPKSISKAIYPKEVLAIHNEFEIASDKLLEEANNIINNQPKINESKINRLSKFGFNQVKEVEIGKNIIKASEISKEQIDLITYYKREYPFNKFITEQQVKAICQKYSLVFGGVNRFKGFVPEKNLKEIENFKLKESEFSYYRRNIYSDSLYITTKQNYMSYKKDYPSEWIMKEIDLSICAPIKDMDTSNMYITDGYKLQHIPDPVVLQKVKGGFLVVTKWGIEAEDPILLNEINN